MNGEADCPTDLEMAAPKGQGMGPQLLFSNLSFFTHELSSLVKGSSQASFCALADSLKS
jgi:hypothetical protein